MNSQNLLAELVAVLEKLRDCHQAWAQLADRHRLDLITHRMDAVSEGARELDDLIEAMGPLEDRRMSISFALGHELGMPRAERPPMISELCANLGEVASRPLVDVAKRLRQAVGTAVTMAERNRMLAESGQRVAEATVKALAQMVVRASSTQAAYDRAGARSTGVVAPVFQHSWKG